MDVREQGLLSFVPGDKVDEDKLLEVALDAGADDAKRIGEQFEITSPEAFHQVTEALTKAEIPMETHEVTRIPKDTVAVNDPDMARRVLKLVERLDDHEDVQGVSANFDIPDEVMAEAAG